MSLQQLSFFQRNIHQMVYMNQFRFICISNSISVILTEDLQINELEKKTEN